MELLAPAGNFDKLAVAFHYGADAVYAGGSMFNLRVQSGNFTLDTLRAGIDLAHSFGKKVYLTLNAFAEEKELTPLREYLTEIKSIPADGYIVADPGMFDALLETIPDANVHISTQANVTNSASARFWERLGAKRIILARECTLTDIRSIREKVSLELETFVHGAMCVAYSGRCLLSNYLKGRDANRGDCAQCCRWEYRVLEERSRPGEYFPVVEGDGYTSIMSSKDLVMAPYLDTLRDAGVDSIKIEGRMKSVYYVANVVRVYRRLLDALSAMPKGASFADRIVEADLAPYLHELGEVSRRESDTGFYFRDVEGEHGIEPTLASYRRGRRLMGMTGRAEATYVPVRVYNTIKRDTPLTAIGRDYVSRELDEFRLFVKDDDGFNEVEQIRNVDTTAYIMTAPPLGEYDILTTPDSRVTVGRR